MDNPFTSECLCKGKRTFCCICPITLSFHELFTCDNIIKLNLLDETEYCHCTEPKRDICNTILKLLGFGL